MPRTQYTERSWGVSLTTTVRIVSSIKDSSEGLIFGSSGRNRTFVSALSAQGSAIELQSHNLLVDWIIGFRHPSTNFRTWLNCPIFVLRYPTQDHPTLPHSRERRTRSYRDATNKNTRQPSAGRCGPNFHTVSTAVGLAIAPPFCAHRVKYSYDWPRLGATTYRHVGSTSSLLLMPVMFTILWPVIRDAIIQNKLGTPARIRTATNGFGDRYTTVILQRYYIGGSPGIRTLN